MIRTLPLALLILAAAPATAREATPSPTIGSSKSCVTLNRVRDQIVDKTGITFREGDRWYHNNAGGNCPLRPGRGFASRTPSNQLCRGDIITVFEPGTPIPYGSCGLDDFTEVAKPVRQRR